jgi:hypothetical protein
MLITVWLLIVTGSRETLYSWTVFGCYAEIK